MWNSKRMQNSSIRDTAVKFWIYFPCLLLCFVLFKTRISTYFEEIQFLLSLVSAAGRKKEGCGWDFQGSDGLCLCPNLSGISNDRDKNVGELGTRPRVLSYTCWNWKDFGAMRRLTKIFSELSLKLNFIEKNWILSKLFSSTLLRWNLRQITLEQWGTSVCWDSQNLDAWGHWPIICSSYKSTQLT